MLHLFFHILSTSICSLQQEYNSDVDKIEPTFSTAVTKGKNKYTWRKMTASSTTDGELGPYHN
jgi:hypothetical protein